MKFNLLSFAMLSVLTTTAFAADNFLSQTQFSLDSRLRYELVDQDNQLKNADAWTLRLRPSL
ncbi:MAG: alginate export family protein, partial [Acinetobacter sp.]